MKTEYAGYAGGAYPKKKKSVGGQFATVKYNSETYCSNKKTNQGRLHDRQVLGTSCCCKRLNTVEKQLTPLLSLGQISRLRFEISRPRLRFLAG